MSYNSSCLPDLTILFSNQTFDVWWTRKRGGRRIQIIPNIWPADLHRCAAAHNHILGRFAASPPDCMRACTQTSPCWFTCECCALWHLSSNLHVPLYSHSLSNLSLSLSLLALSFSLPQMTVKGSIGFCKTALVAATLRVIRRGSNGFPEQSCDTEQIRPSIRIKATFYIQINFKSLFKPLRYTRQGRMLMHFSLLRFREWKEIRGIGVTMRTVFRGGGLT